MSLHYFTEKVLNGKHLTRIEMNNAATQIFDQVDTTDEIKIESFTTTITVEDEIKEVPRKRKNKKNNIVNVD